MRFLKASPLVLIITSIVCSRAMFAFFDDPDGPNLLVVMGMAAIVYCASWAMCGFVFSAGPRGGLKGLLLAILIQIFVTSCLYLLLSFLFL
jgi:hypothetical protein